MNMYKDASSMQKAYKKMVNTNTLTKKAVCELCVPFRDKYQLSDLQTLRIAREEMSLMELTELAERSDI